MPAASTTDYQKAGTPAAAPALAASAPILRNLGAQAANLTCPYCAQTVRTRTRSVMSGCTWISVVVLLLFAWPFFWVPFICPSVSGVRHAASPLAAAPV